MCKAISFKKELIRKSIHLTTSIIPIAYYTLFEREQILVLCISIFVLFLTGDILRIYVTQMKQFYENIFGRLLRDNETGKSLNGATLLFLGFVMSVLLFDKNIAIMSMLFLSISDSIAALIGKSIGKHKIFNKTMEGTIGFFLSAAIISTIFFHNVIAGLLIALSVAIIELIPTKINDNILIPLVSGVFFTIADKV